MLTLKTAKLTSKCPALFFPKFGFVWMEIASSTLSSHTNNNKHTNNFGVSMEGEEEEDEDVAFLRHKTVPFHVDGDDDDDDEGNRWFE
jgi:hypothetical protein